jgi:hypothetical protein
MAARYAARRKNYTYTYLNIKEIYLRRLLSSVFSLLLDNHISYSWDIKVLMSVHAAWKITSTSRRNTNQANIHKHRFHNCKVIELCTFVIGCYTEEFWRLTPSVKAQNNCFLRESKHMYITVACFNDAVRSTMLHRVCWHTGLVYLGRLLLENELILNFVMMEAAGSSEKP